MAIIKCVECNNDISDEAKVCPHCGIPTKKSGGILKYIGYFAGFIVFVLIIGNLPLKSSSGPISTQDSKKTQCENMVKSLLKSPSTADFSNVHEDYLGKINGDVDSQNGFGATVRSSFICKFNTEESGKRAITNICIDGKDLFGGDGCY